MNQKRNQKIQEVRETQISVFGSIGPAEQVVRATATANALAPLIESKKLYSMIAGKKYVRAEGWATLGALLGVFPEVEWTKPLKINGTDSIKGYEARVTLKTLKGESISAGEAMCTRDEKNWATRDDYALRSMAQTRATGKAFRLPFAWIMALGGYQPTPAEEMEGVTGGEEQNNAPQGHTEPYFNGSAHIKPENRDKPATPAQVQAIYKIIAKKTGKTDSQENIDTNIKEVYSIDMATITMGEASELIETLQGE